MPFFDKLFKVIVVMVRMADVIVLPDPKISRYDSTKIIPLPYDFL